MELIIDFFKSDQRVLFARKVQPYVDIAKEKLKDENVANFFENFKHENMKESDKVIFFDNINDLISHVEEFPEYKRIIR